MAALLQIRGILGLQSREGRDVENYFNSRLPIPGVQIASQNARQQYRSGRHRPTEPSARYNCHGLTFAARRTAIEKPEEVEQLIREDEYQRVPRSEVVAGDIILYYQAGVVEHSGIVTETGALGQIWILSKWGEMHEVIHQPHDCMYDAEDLRFFRVVK